MNSIYLGEEHERFRQEVRRFVTEEVVPHVEDWERAREIPREIFERMGELGFLGILAPEDQGGAAADIFFAIVFLEELARSTIGGFGAAVSVQQFMATPHIARHGSGALKRLYLQPSVQGRKVGALAITEPDTGSDVAAIRTSAVRDGDRYIVNGSKTFITNGVHGDFFTTAVRTGGAGAAGISLLAIDATDPGVTSRALEKMGWHASDTAEIVFEDALVPLDRLIGAENAGFAMLMESLQLERIASAAISVGSAQVALEITTRYMHSRESFGRTLAGHQVLRHCVAQLDAELEAARQLTYHAAWLLGQGPQMTREASMAKLITSELGKAIADACVQIHGGYGYMEEFPAARLYRDARAATITAGTSEIMRELIARYTLGDGK